ncbi:hypothetical protein ACP70R_032865 [Stipagrostis hirtigluma subsp. patula]
MVGPSSPRREHDGDASGGGSTPAREKERPRSFDEKTRSACWRKAAVVMGRHPERWRQDAAGNVVCRRFWSCHGCLCYEYDHIVPYSKGLINHGLAKLWQGIKLALQWERGSFPEFGSKPIASRIWLTRNKVNAAAFPGGDSTVENCQILQTRVNRSKSDKAWVEQAEMRGFSCDIKFTGELHKELDIIEMAVYGDVIRPGKQCRCRTVAEMLGKVKSKSNIAACELPDNNAS